MPAFVEDPIGSGLFLLVPGGAPEPTPTTGWHDLTSARDEWSGAEAISDARLTTLLAVAKAQCIAYAPALAVDEAVPVLYREAQLVQARDVHNSARVGGGGAFDENSYASQPFPLSWRVKGLLRPQRGVPAVG